MMHCGRFVVLKKALNFVRAAKIHVIQCSSQTQSASLWSQLTRQVRETLQKRQINNPINNYFQRIFISELSRIQLTT